MTTAAEERMLREQAMAFFGTVTASVSHELNNAIAIIEQAAGLLEDLTLEAEGGTGVGSSELQRIADRIGKQAVRGAQIVRRLNAFAHSVDDTEKDIDVNELAANIVALSQRLADLRRIELEMMSSRSPVAIRSSPFLVQQALFLMIQRAMSLAKEGDKIAVAITERDDAVDIGVRYQPAHSEPSLDLSYLELLVGRLGGMIRTLKDAERVSLELAIPRILEGT